MYLLRPTVDKLQPVATMLQFRLYGGESLPTGLEGFVKAGANIGSVIGQFAFGAMAIPTGGWKENAHYSMALFAAGYMADRFGRKAICAYLIWLRSI